MAAWTCNFCKSRNKGDNSKCWKCGKVKDYSGPPRLSSFCMCTADEQCDFHKRGGYTTHEDDRSNA